MLKYNQRILNNFHIIIDIILLFLAYEISYFLKFDSPLSQLDFFYNSGYYYPRNIYEQKLIYLVPAYVVFYFSFNLYNPMRSNSKRKELWNVIKANIIGLLYFTFILYLMKDVDISRQFISIFCIVNIVFCAGFRFLLLFILERLRKNGFNITHILIVGYSRTAEAYIDKILANPQWGYNIHGILDDNMEKGTSYRGIKITNNILALQNILEKNDFDEIVVTLSINEYSKLENIVATCEKSGIHTKFVPDYNNIIATKPYTEDLNGLPVINIRKIPLSNTFYKILKRTTDIFGSLFALLLFGIPMIIVAIIIKYTSKGPIIFSQIRVGLHNKEFKMYKFRSMVLQDEKAEKKAWTTENDPRITPIGKFIRKTSIDELPQLFNVLKGDMSLVGPRPERPFFVEKFKEEIPRYMIKHQVRPGITGWAQINGFRGDTSIIKRIEHDLYYIENWTYSLDIKILFLTIFKGFVNKNAY